MRKKLALTFNDEVMEMLAKDAAACGVSRSAYVSMLVVQKNIETSSMRIFKNMTDEQMKQAVIEQMNPPKKGLKTGGK